MKNPLLISCLALLFSALALGAMFLDSRAARPPGAGAGDEALRPDFDLFERLERLELENAELRRRLVGLELRPVPGLSQRGAAGGEFVPLAEFEAFREELEQERVLRRAERRMVSPEFKAQLTDALSELEHEKAVANALSGQEKRLARLEETMPELEEWLELSPYQSAAMRSALLNGYEREALMVQRWADGEDAEALGVQKTTDRKAQLAELAGILTHEQMRAYQARGGGK